jgi:hypothetical protein
MAEGFVIASHCQHNTLTRPLLFLCASQNAAAENAQTKKHEMKFLRRKKSNAKRGAKEISPLRGKRYFTLFV